MSIPEEPLTVVANERAGAIEGLDQAVAALRASLETAVVRVSGPGDLVHALAGAVPGVLVAAGGDGTLNMVVQHLWAHDLLERVVVGLLPLGTGNDLARTVGIPRDAEAAAAVVLEGRSRALDLLVNDAGAVAVNAVHGGIGGLVAVRAAPLKPFLGRMAYAAGAAVAGARAPGWEARVEVDGAVLVKGPMLFAGVGNGMSIGGGTVLWPLARPDDGLAEVTVAFAGNTWARLRLAGALRSGDPRRVDGVVVGRGSVVRIDGEPMPYNADGEPLPPAPARTWRVRPQAWRLLAPALPADDVDGARSDVPSG